MKKKTSEIGAVLITGAAKRIGREVALNLAKMGYDVIISYNKSELAAKNLAKKNFDRNIHSDQLETILTLVINNKFKLVSEVTKHFYK